MDRRLRSAALRPGDPSHDAGKPATEDSATATLEAIGRRIRRIRSLRGLTLGALATEAGLSPSMLSLVERGRASPSLSSLVAIAKALGVALTRLVVDEIDDEPVTRFHEQPVLETPKHVLRRVLRDDRVRGVMITHNEYAAGAGNSPTPIIHAGHEFGIVVDGELTVELDGVSYVLKPGDLIAHDSARPHRIWNYGRRPARAFWFNVSRRGSE